MGDILFVVTCMHLMYLGTLVGTDVLYGRLLLQRIYFCSRLNTSSLGVGSLLLCLG